MFRNLALLIVFLAFCAVLAGAFVRLSDAGLACPDWPGCFGQLAMPDSRIFTDQSGQTPGGLPPDLGKARISMSHRYLAASTAGLIIVLWLAAFFLRLHRKTAILLATLLAATVVLQIALGMGVVRYKLMPVLVSGHFAAGLLLLSAAFWIVLRIHPKVRFVEKRSAIGLWAKFSLLVLVFEMMLGNWTGANYAALACPDFPTCLGSWWPSGDYFRIFSVFQGSEWDYRGGVLSHDARIAINWFHRLGAFFSFVVLGGLALSLSSSQRGRELRKTGVLLSALLLVQVALGIGMVMFRMPIPVAVAHSAVASLLLLTVIYITFRAGREVAAAEETLIRPSLARDASGLAAEVLPVPEQVLELAPEAEPVNLFQRLRTQLKKTRSGLTELLAAIPVGKKEIDSDLLEDIESTLILADIGVEATREIIDNLTRSVERKQLSDAAALGTALRENLLAMLKPCDLPLIIEPGGKTFVILVVGVNGVGKTTTIGKLAKRLQSKGLSVMLAAGDTFRAAAIEQLQVWGERNGVPVVAQHTGADSASVVFDALQSARARGIDVLIADTAGRLHTKDNLMEELRKVKRILARLDPDAPHEVLLIVDAGTGQNALSQAEQFNQVVGLTGIALTKLDGTAKGGVIFALAKRLRIPIRYIGIGEGLNDLQDFNAESFVDALFAVDAKN
ncbi:MAG: signal recognition particle-docking protein FtsY [Methylococcaceae bacterium]|nr:signal recognition particle-docking protein FtsY [Methylococcaceae bacterium]